MPSTPTTTQAPLQQKHSDHDEQHRPVPADMAKHGYAKVIQQEQRSQADEQRGPDGRIHLHVAESKPFRRALPQLLRFGSLVGINHHIKVKRRRAQAENGVHGATHAIAYGDERAEYQHLDHGLNNLAVINSAHPGDET